MSFVHPHLFLILIWVQLTGHGFTLLAVSSSISQIRGLVNADSEILEIFTI
jgi:hypothetical protein